MQSMYINGHAVAHTSKYNIIKLNSLPVSKKHCFQLDSEFLFSHFSYIFQPDGSSTQILGLLTSRSETKLKGWMLNTEEVRCQLPPTLRCQIWVQTGTYLLPVLPYILLPGIQWYQWPITAQISCTCAQGSAIPLATFVFNSLEPWVIVLDCTEKPRR